jgi:glycosyltransferase involved in cell wall biosynthesis
MISVVMPLFNAADTLAVALASLQAQICENWECIVVDDGSTDNPDNIIRTIGDPRIKYHPLERNRGRGYARQIGLEIARGKYIAFLDADDWMYPEKLGDQKAVLEAEPSVALISTGMAISNSSDQLVGVRTRSQKTFAIYPPMQHLGMPPFAFAPSMIVGELARNTGFDRSFPISEDVDFLVRVLAGKRYAILHSPLYVYREQGLVSPEKVQTSLSYCCRMFAKQFDRHPVETVFEIAKVRGKQFIYHTASACGLWDYVINHRSQIPNAADHRRFHDARQIISERVVGYRVPVRSLPTATPNASTEEVFAGDHSPMRPRSRVVDL